MSDSRLQSGKIQGGHETLTRIINDLRSKEERIRLKAANNLHQYISSESREISGEAFTKFMEGVSRRIFELVSSSDINEKMGGILAIDKMIDIDFEESATKITRFANYLRPVFPNNDAMLMVMASKVLGHLAHAAGTLTADFVEFELKRALEWLQSERNEAKRHASVLILKELAENSGILFYTYIEQFLESIWPSLRDPKLTIREAAVDALRACFSLIALRDTPQRAAWYRKIFEEAQRGIEKANVDSVHGSLLAIGELIRNSSDFMVSHFRDMCDLILRHREHRDRLIKRTVIVLLPRLAEFSVAHNHVREVKSAFQESLDIAMQLLFKALSKDGDRSFAYISLAEMISAMQQFNAQYLDEIIARIKDGLANKTKKTYFVEAVSCVSVLARAVKDQLKPHAVGLLDNLGYTPLSQSLIDAMSDMALYIPDLLSDIQSRLIQRFKTILSALSSRQLVSPQQRRLTVGALSSPLAQANLLDMVDTDSIILAIKTLGTFNFRGHMLIDFARDVVLSYTDDDNPLIRKEAALTCSKLLSSPDQSAPTKGQAAIVIGEVLAKLLTVAISDPDPSIRSTIFSSFDPRLDHHLAQPENLNSLFIALNDEVFEIRGLAISLMGRLALRNPAFVMPTLRKTLIQLMTELEYSGDLRNKEESAQLLACLIRSSHRLTKPYMEPVLKAIVPKLREGSQGLSIWILDVLGALAEVSGEEMCAYFDELMPMVMEAMQDQSSGHKREVALTTLRQLVLSTGKAITPYTKYPQLLNILLQMLKTELSGPIRTEVLKVLGTLGAFDPYRHKVNQLDTQGRANHVHVHSHKQDEIDSTLDLLPGMGSSSEEYCPTVAISALMRILRDPSLSIHHTSVIQAVMYIFKNLGTKSVPFLPYVMPPFLQVMRTCEAQFREYLFTQLGQLVGIVKQHIKKYLDDIFALIHENWLGLINHILPLVEGISLALNDEFKVYLPDLIPMMLNVLHTDRSERRSATQKVLHAFEVFGANLDDYLHLVIPAVVRLFEQVDAPVNVRLNAIQTLAKLSRKLDFSDYASRIIHPLARVLDVTYHELRREAMETFCVLVYQLGPDYAIFAPKVNKVLAKQRIQHARYEQLVSKLLKNQRLPQDGMEFDDRSDLRGADDSPLADSLNTKKLNVHQANLKKTWEVTQCSNKEDWIDWSRRFALELLRESSSPALRACSALAQVYPTLSRELFNAGFVSCWTELHEANQDSLVTSLESALKSSTIPPEILQVLLNLAEFMEHDDKPLPIDIKTLGTLAEKCHAYAKALHYKEIEFHSSPNTLSETIEALISINNQLQQPEAADGILKYAENTMERVSLIKESWYEKLHRWRDALEAYGRRQLEDPQSAAVAMGMMRCYNALGEWDPLAELSETHWALVDDEQRRTIAPLAASAAWNLGAWDHLEKYVLAIDEKSIDGCFFRAILSLHLGEYERAQLFIDSARVKLDTELTALIGESYDRAYNQVVKVQQLTELEEMILYKRSSSLPEMQYTIRKLWNERLAGCQRNVEFWQQLLGIRSLVLEPHESIDMHIKFASLCRKSGRLSMSSKSLMKLLGGDSTNLPPNRVGYAYIKHMWDAGAKDVAIDKLKVFVQHSEDDTKLRARCHLLLGRWQQAQDDGFQESTVTEIMHHYRMATEYDSAWYKAWHAWALSNFEVANHHFKNHVTPEKFSAYVVSAVQGFFRSIALGPGGSSSLQDTLRLLTLWFQFGSFKDVEDALKDGFPTVSIDTWLQVIPQLIARIHSGAAPVRRLVHDLLSTVGKEHPQALIYPLTVASKSQAESRKNAALDILNKMRQHSAVLVEQAVLVSQELIRVAIIWHEMWHEGLEEASRLYFGDHNVEGMFDILKPLHEMMDRGPETMREVAFQQAYGRDLQEALEWCKKYQRSEKIIDLNQAWDMYYQVFRRINKQLPQLTSLDLQYVSPRLQECQNLDLAVPGTYKVGEDVVKIRAFSQTLSVITSKQRPRKLNIHGSDGNDYHFLLKGHEDLRQDERVMQLFGLVNTLLATNPETAKTHLSIRRYSVIPLAPNSGLIGWVPNCDTLHALIRDYRESRKILLNIEHRLMLQMAPDFENLSLIQKVEVFEYALENTTGQDLYKVLWLKSKNSEAWLDRRTNYTRSLAVMSMVGYILGLGDRHPSNLMMDRRSGKILHIDFGDCFEVAMVREKFPEKIPFRLTRMLIQAMEVSGIEGNYRSTCERVMAVLRENKESLMAVLEAFVHDPLINWRLLTTSPKQDKARGRKSDDDIEDEQPTILSPQQHRNRELSVSIANDEAEYPRLNERALAVVERVQNKLTGKDFASEAVDVPQQVQLLIQQATSHENLCQCYIGWCPFW